MDVILDLIKKTFVVYVLSLDIIKSIHLAQKAQTVLLMAGRRTAQAIGY